jgi:hypothetical protein
MQVLFSPSLIRRSLLSLVFLSFLLFLLILISMGSLTGCAKEQDHYNVPPDIWHALTPEQQQLIAQESSHYQARS